MLYLHSDLMELTFPLKPTFITLYNLIMKRNFCSLFILSVLVSLFSCQQKKDKLYNEGVNIIPVPAHMELSKGSFKLTPDFSIVATDSSSKKVALFFASKIQKSTGYTVPVADKLSKEALELLLVKPNSSMGEEAYTLSVKKEGVKIVAATAKGLFYGMQSFMQLLPAEIESPVQVANIPWKAPCVLVKDAPRFAYRGVMLDPCRHFMSVADIKKQLDVMAMFKLNVFHWHLTEDQAWRIEIKKYPKLTEVGSTRVENDGTVLSGFYTQEQIKDVVAYAAARQITVVPELEMPGHELAAIAAYPWLSCNNEVTTPRTVWGVEDVVMCPGKESTFTFLENVIKEMIPLFPGTYFHIGGDECPKKSWKNCPLCQRRIRQEKLKGNKEHTAEERLQSYVICRIEKVLNSYGKKLIGWDEILEGGIAPSATIMSWRGEAGGIKSALMEHDVVMTPGSGGLYVDHYQGDPKVEPVAIGGYAPLAKTYSYNPVPDTLVAMKKEQFIKGVQCNVWSEYMYTNDLREYRLYPRALAVAEVGWSPLDKKDFKDFCRRLENAYVRLDLHQINAHVPLPEQENGSCNFVAFTDTAKLTFKTSRPVKMYYTTDGSEPTLAATPYTTPLLFTANTTLKIRTILLSGKMSKVRTIKVEKQALAPAATVAAKNKGLKVEWTKGEYFTTDQLSAATQWTKTTIKDLNELLKIVPVPRNMRNVNFYSAVAEGYIAIPADGVYYFSSDLAQVWLDGKLLIDNNGEVKRYSRHDKSVALAKGNHAFKVIFLGHVQGGWPTYWSHNVPVRLRAAEDTVFTPVAASQLFY